MGVSQRVGNAGWTAAAALAGHQSRNFLISFEILSPLRATTFSLVKLF
jgi:hypothetical protein